MEAKNNIMEAKNNISIDCWDNKMKTNLPDDIPFSKHTFVSLLVITVFN